MDLQSHQNEQEILTRPPVFSILIKTIIKMNLLINLKEGAREGITEIPVCLGDCQPLKREGSGIKNAAGINNAVVT